MDDQYIYINVNNSTIYVTKLYKPIKYFKLLVQNLKHYVPIFFCRLWWSFLKALQLDNRGSYCLPPYTCTTNCHLSTIQFTKVD